MKYATATAFRAALEARLRSQATEGHASLVRLRKHVVFDRLLARLLVVSPNQWILKGGLALDFRYGDRARTTVDMDLAMRSDGEQVTTAMTAAQHVDLDDRFVFAIRRSSALRITEGSAMRFRILAKLDDRKFEEVSVDIGLGIGPASATDILRGPALLQFAGIPAIEVPAISLSLHVAEKLHAYTQTFPDGRANTRVKDLIDLNLIPSFSTFGAAALRMAVDEAFGARESQGVPDRLPPPPSNWRASYAKLAADVGLEPNLAAGHARAAAFLDPLLQGDVDDSSTWDSSIWSWR